jgi:hypothetical protein
MDTELVDYISLTLESIITATEANLPKGLSSQDAIKLMLSLNGDDYRYILKGNTVKRTVNGKRIKVYAHFTIDKRYNGLHVDVA